MQTRRKQKKGGSRSSSRSRSSNSIKFENSIYKQLDKCIKDLIIDLASGKYRFSEDGDQVETSNFSKKMKTKNMTFEQAISACTKELLEKNKKFLELYNEIVELDLGNMPSNERDEIVMDKEYDIGSVVVRHYGIHAANQLDEDDAGDVRSRIFEAIKIFPKATIAAYSLRKATGQEFDPETIAGIDEYLNTKYASSSEEGDWQSDSEQSGDY
jgi:hypothetical protein